MARVLFPRVDYIRPSSGEYSGQLGPWASLIHAAGMDPESTAMKALFVIWGVVGLVITTAFALDRPWAWIAMLLVSIGTLWYLIPGTILSIMQILLLLVIRHIK